MENIEFMNKEKKIKVEFFTDVLRENLDGVTYTLYNIIERIPKDKFEYIFITPFPPSENVKLPFPVIVCPYIRFPLYGAYPLAIPFFSRKLKKTLDNFEPDIIHFTTPSFLGRYALNYALKKKIQLFSTYHTHFLSYIGYYKMFTLFNLLPFWMGIGAKVTKFFYNKCLMSFVPTDPILEELIEVGIDKKRLKIWGRGIDTKKYNPTYRDTEYINKLAGEGSKKILFVSRLVNEKEVTTLLNIYKKFEKTRPDIKMVLTGDGPEENMLRKNMPNAVFTGKLIDDDLARIYASCDLFIFPSITETFGNVVLEALASGLPAVVAAQGGPKGIVKHGKTGFHAEPKDAADFCEQILKILDNPKLKKKMSSDAVKYAKSQSWDTLCDDMFQTYINYSKKQTEKIEEIDGIAI